MSPPTLPSLLYFVSPLSFAPHRLPIEHAPWAHSGPRASTVDLPSAKSQEKWQDSVWPCNMVERCLRTTNPTLLPCTADGLDKKLGMIRV
jgi:hypothetical protein